MTDPFSPPPGAKVEHTTFPKDCVLCDVCNAQLSDGNFIAIADCQWYEGYLYCNDCIIKYEPKKFLKLIMDIKEGDDLSNTDLAKPMEFTSW